MHYSIPIARLDTRTVSSLLNSTSFSIIPSSFSDTVLSSDFFSSSAQIVEIYNISSTNSIQELVTTHRKNLSDFVCYNEITDIVSTRSLWPLKMSSKSCISLHLKWTTCLNITRIYAAVLGRLEMEIKVDGGFRKWSWILVLRHSFYQVRTDPFWPRQKIREIWKIKPLVSTCESRGLLSSRFGESIFEIIGSSISLMAL